MLWLIDSEKKLTQKWNGVVQLQVWGVLLILGTFLMLQQMLGGHRRQRRLGWAVVDLGFVPCVVIVAADYPSQPIGPDLFGLWVVRVDGLRINGIGLSVHNQHIVIWEF